MKGGIVLEWGRAKTILIITFFLLNVILGYQLFIYANWAGSYLESAEIREEMNQLLRSKQIRLDKEIPRETPKLREITVAFQRADQEDGMVYLQDPFPVQQLFKQNKSAKEFRSRIAHFDSYQYDPFLSDHRTLVFHQLYERWPMFEISMELHHDGEFITRYNQRFGIIETEKEEEEQQVLSAYRAVGFLAENVLSQGTIIEDVQLGYHGQVFDSDRQVLAPKWRVVTSEGEVYYVHAINGAVEKKE